MELRATDDGWVFEDMDPFIVDLLRALPGCAVPDDEDSRARIFSSLTGGVDSKADKEWREEVEPELHDLFQGHLDVVKSDLSTIQSEGDISTLKIAQPKARAWIHTLNQARLALGARYGVTEEDSTGKRRNSGPKAFALMQIDFYGMLLSFLLARAEF